MERQTASEWVRDLFPGLDLSGLEISDYHDVGFDGVQVGATPISRYRLLRAAAQWADARAERKPRVTSIFGRP